MRTETREPWHGATKALRDHHRWIREQKAVESGEWPLLFPDFNPGPVVFGDQLTLTLKVLKKPSKLTDLDDECDRDVPEVTVLEFRHTGDHGAVIHHVYIDDPWVLTWRGSDYNQLDGIYLEETVEWRLPTCSRQIRDVAAGKSWARPPFWFDRHEAGYRGLGRPNLTEERLYLTDGWRGIQAMAIETYAQAMAAAWRNARIRLGHAGVDAMIETLRFGLGHALLGEAPGLPWRP